MDIGAQTLAQLALENQDAKFVTIETGSKISGYTPEYLERLCRLNKIRYRLWNNGVFVIELESLLRETHTILLSYEGITFVDKSELTDPTPQLVANILSSTLAELRAAPAPADEPLANTASFGVDHAHPMPRFGAASYGTNSIAFVGRAVMSDSKNPGKEEAPHMSTPHAFVERQILDVQELEAPEFQPQAGGSEQKEINSISDISYKKGRAIEGVAPTPSPQPVVTPEDNKKEIPYSVQHIPVTPETNTPAPESAKASGDVKKEEPLSKADEPSPYRPIKTSPDPREHHDDGMLFPQLSKQKVVVFEPEAFAQGAHGQNLKADLAPRNESLHEPSALEISAAELQAELLGKDQAALPRQVTELVEKKPLPIMRVMPQLPVGEIAKLPMKSEEHHLAIRDPRQLMKNVGLNVAIVLFVASSLYLADGMIKGKIGSKLNTTSYAAVGSVKKEESDPQKANEKVVPPAFASTTSDGSSEVIQILTNEFDGY